MPGGAPLTGPATAPPRYIARWRFAYRAYDYTSPLTYTMTLRISGLRLHGHAPEQLPDGAALIGPTIELACTGTNCPMALRLSGLRCTGMHRNNCPMALRLSGLRMHWHAPQQLPDGAALIGPMIALACIGTIARWRYAYRAYDCTACTGTIARWRCAYWAYD